MRAAALAALACAVIAVPARAERPTDGVGLWSFTAQDEVTFYDHPTGWVRVHYSASGPNMTLTADADGSGVPDYVETTADAAVDALEFYEKELGFLPPVKESELGLGPLGGSDALDIYLVDFGLSSDGHFTVDACTAAPSRCAGHMLVENDFFGYGYPSKEFALRLLTSHELFHAIQAAYNAEHPVWFSEGTAVWASAAHGPGDVDLIGAGSAFLDEAWRSLNKPPAGPVPPFAYGTALFFDFLAIRHDNALIEEIMTGTAGATAGTPPPLDAITDALEGRGDTLKDAWGEFASWNLATGARSGIVDGYTYADDLGGVTSEAEGSFIDDDNRFFSLSARYYRYDHTQGPLWFGISDARPGLVFALHQVAAAQPDGRVKPAFDRWEATEAAAHPILDGAILASGGYWLVVAYGKVDTSSAKARICLGSEELARSCAPEPMPEPEPEPEPELSPEPTPELEADAASWDAADTGDSAPELTETHGGSSNGGCAAGSTPTTPGGWLVVVLLLAVTARATPRSRQRRAPSVSTGRPDREMLHQRESREAAGPLTPPRARRAARCCPGASRPWRRSRPGPGAGRRE